MLLFAFFTLVNVYDMIVLVKGSNWQCSMINSNHRTNCGYPHISNNECIKQGCCYDSSEKYAYWCFYPSPMCRGSLNYYCIEGTKNERYSCGYPEISETECNKRGCCFDTSVPNFPPCFYNRYGVKGVNFVSGEPNKNTICFDLVPPTKRVKCGCDIISKSECEYLKCCFDDSMPNAHFCYYPSTMTKGGLSYLCKQMNPTDRVICGYPAISEDDCNKRNCCFDDSIANALWCFFPSTELINEVGHN